MEPEIDLNIDFRLCFISSGRFEKIKKYIDKIFNRMLLYSSFEKEGERND